MASAVITLLYGRGLGGPLAREPPAESLPGAPADVAVRDATGVGELAGGEEAARAQPVIRTAPRMRVLRGMIVAVDLVFANRFCLMLFSQ